MSTPMTSQFERRFDHVVVRSRLTGILTILGWAALVFCVCLSLMAGADYFLEISWKIRAWFLGLLSAAGLILAGRRLTFVFRNNTRRSTAAAVENRFEDLGQSVRTSVELGAAAEDSDQFSSSLMKALNNDVRERTDELRLTEAIPTRALKLGFGLLTPVLILIVATCSASWEWRTAARRVLAARIPYTEIRIDPGNVRVRQNESLRLVASIAGRTDAEAALLTRDLEDSESEWQMRPLTGNDQIDEGGGELTYAVSISKIQRPIEYRVVAGDYSSSVHTVDVQYPLVIDSFETKVEAPEYTQLEPRFVTAGNFDGVEGSIAHLRVQLNQPADKAWLETRPLVTRLGEDAETEAVSLAINGRVLSAELHLDRDLTYQVFATSADGLELKPNRYRIRVHEDRPPRVAFQTLKASARVHPLSELELKLSVKDDYGLQRAGIVFQFNNEPPLVLESVDFEDIVRPDGTLTPRTKESVRTFLELEYLEMTERDSLSYYGFAEDKRPGGSNINETDLRFIDVLPFRRQFVQLSGSPGLARGGLGRRRNPNSRPQLPQLGTLISKERFVLNRSIQMERSDRRGQRINVVSLDSAVNAQNKNSEGTGRLGDRLFDLEMRFGIPEEGRVSDLLYQARDSMLLAADSLNDVEFEVATLQERDALGYLNEAREKIETQYRGRRFGGFRRAIAGLAGGMRNSQAQRRSQKMGQQARLNQIVMRLKDAATRQESVLKDYAKVVRVKQAGDGQSMAELERIQKVQARLLADLRSVADSVAKVEGLSELSVQRSLQAANTAEGIDDAVVDGDWEAAMEMATRAVPDYRLLATNIEAITATDTSRRIGTARDLGIQLTEVLRGQAQQAMATADDSQESEESNDGSLDNSPSVPIPQVAELNTEIGRTVGDILNSIVDPEAGIADPEDVVVRRLLHLMTEDRLDETIERLPSIADMIKSEDWTEVVVQAEDIADRLDIVTQRLDAMQREIMSPRIERLRQLATRTAEARRELSELTTEDEIDRWHLSLGGLLNDIEESATATLQVEQLRAAIEGDAEDAETDADDSWNWPLNDSQSAFDPPESYLAGLTDVRDEIERHIQELLATGRQMTSEGAVPPKYKQFVELFQRLLSDQANTQTMKESAE